MLGSELKTSLRSSFSVGRGEAFHGLPVIFGDACSAWVLIDGTVRFGAGVRGPETDSLLSLEYDGAGSSSNSGAGAPAFRSFAPEALTADDSSSSISNMRSLCDCLGRKSGLKGSFRAALDVLLARSGDGKLDSSRLPYLPFKAVESLLSSSLWVVLKAISLTRLCRSSSISPANSGLCSCKRSSALPLLTNGNCAS